MLGTDFAVGAFKGQGLSFRRWDQQVRDPILLVDAADAGLGVAAGQFLHQRDAGRHAGL